MENTIENKARFFALYYGTETLSVFKTLNHINYNTLDSTALRLGHLELKPLSSITDEDALEVGYCIVSRGERTLHNDHFAKEDGYAWAKRGGMRPVMNIMECSSAIDYLRYKGYALPCMGLSVETMIEYGWIKLKTK